MGHEVFIMLVTPSATQILMINELIVEINSIANYLFISLLCSASGCVFIEFNLVFN
jgi:hypothetical protein